MKNRAKCKLCSSIIESFHASDYVICKCGEIAVNGGDSMRCSSKNWNNFIRVDDEGNEILIKIKNSSLCEVQEKADTTPNEKNNENANKVDPLNHIPSRKDLLDMLVNMNKSIENLPEHAMSSPINHYDFSALIILLLAILKEDCN